MGQKVYYTQSLYDQLKVYSPYTIATMNSTCFIGFGYTALLNLRISHVELFHCCIYIVCSVVHELLSW